MAKKKKSKGYNTENNNHSEPQYNSLAKEIAAAYFEIEEQKKKRENLQEEKEHKEWLDILGQKHYPENEKGILKKIHQLRNDIVGTWKLLFIKPQDVRDIHATFGLISMATTLVFRGCKWVLYLLATYILWLSLIHKQFLILGIGLAIMVFMIARLFRIAAFEIDRMRDVNMLLTIFSTVLTCLTVIIPVITFFINKFF